ncbi:MAG: hypothetical protein XD36_0055 [Halomonas sp. 54_146]|nr:MULTISPECIES: hypothetical protein [unclassified Halomonas]KUJ89432.1 MAG: hypothetical protein XD36_0055 [Halomonas sp. 54_146]HAA46136.1 hypothetical protein [Halomonas sp.]
MNVSLPGTPQAFRGVWRRTLYAEPATKSSATKSSATKSSANDPYQQADTTTQVYWLQGKHWHADLRLPTDSPDFAGITGLHDCNRRQLEWLAGLTAFAGITQIEGEQCVWHRYQDLCPSLERDVGLLRWIDSGTLEERHPNGRYVEHWVKHRQQLANAAVEEVIQIDEQGYLRWLQIGDHAIAITPRTLPANPDTLFTPVSGLTDDALRWRASLCFDHLQHSKNGWQIKLSTQPWRVGLVHDGATSLLAQTCSSLHS